MYILLECCIRINRNEMFSPLLNRKKKKKHIWPDGIKKEIGWNCVMQPGSGARSLSQTSGRDSADDDVT